MFLIIKNFFNNPKIKQNQKIFFLPDNKNFLINLLLN